MQKLLKMNKIKTISKLIKDVKEFPKKSITLGGDETGKRLFDNFTSKHPKLFLVKKKTIGVALVDKSEFASPEVYLKSVNGKNSAAYYSRKAAAAGCTFMQIDANKHVDEIHEIHLSAASRQGRKMDATYEEKIVDYPVDDNNLYFAVCKDNKVVAYLWIVKTGDLMLMNRIMGHTDFLDFGVMYLLVTAFVQHAFSLPATYIMYDTLLGGGDGLKLFKKRCGFKPYRVKWILS